MPQDPRVRPAWTITPLRLRGGVTVQVGRSGAAVSVPPVGREHLDQVRAPEVGEESAFVQESPPCVLAGC